MGTTEHGTEALVERVFAAGLGMGEILTIHLGVRLGFYRALRDRGPLSAPELSDQTTTFERYAREWLEQQAAAGILTVDDVGASADRRRYALPHGHAAPLLDPDSPSSIEPFARSFVALAAAMPAVEDAFRTGNAVPWSAYGRVMTEAQGDFNRPWLLGSLGTRTYPPSPTCMTGCPAVPGRWPTWPAVWDGRASPWRRPTPRSRSMGSTSTSCRSTWPGSTRTRRGWAIASPSTREMLRRPGIKVSTTWRSSWNRSTTWPSPSTCWPASGAC